MSKVLTLKGLQKLVSNIKTLINNKVSSVLSDSKSYTDNKVNVTGRGIKNGLLDLAEGDDGFIQNVYAKDDGSYYMMRFNINRELLSLIEYDNNTGEFTTLWSLIGINSKIADLDNKINSTNVSLNGWSIVNLSFDSKHTVVKDAMIELAENDIYSMGLSCTGTICVRLANGVDLFGNYFYWVGERLLRFNVSNGVTISYQGSVRLGKCINYKEL